jgi:hypothetical protein
MGFIASIAESMVEGLVIPAIVVPAIVDKVVLLRLLK